MNQHTIIVQPKDYNWSVYLASKDDNNQVNLAEIPITIQSKIKESIEKHITKNFPNKVQQHILEDLTFFFPQIIKIKLAEYFFVQILKNSWLLFCHKLIEKIDKQMPFDIVNQCLITDKYIPYNQKYYQGNIENLNLIEINHANLLVDFYSDELLN